MPSDLAKLAPILPDAVYPLALIAVLTGLGTKGMRAARKAGLRTFYAGRRAFVFGADFRNWLIEQPDSGGPSDRPE